MPEVRYRIEPFADLPGTVQIIGIRNVRRPRGSAIEAELEVILASMPKAGEWDYDRDLHVAWVGCGQMDLLVAGSLWRQGFPVGDVPLLSTSAILHCQSIEKMGEGSIDSPDFFPSKPMANTDCFRFRLYDAAEVKGGPIHVALIPKTEIARALFGVSSRFLLQLIDGMRDPSVGAGRSLYNRTKSGVSANGKVVIWAYRRLTKREAVMVGLIIADDQIRQCHDLVFQQLSVTQAWSHNLPAALNVMWPFRDWIRCSFDGFWLKRLNGEKRFLVTRITEMAIPIPFKEIDLHYPGNSADPSGRSPPPPRVGRLRFGKSEALNLLTGRAPSSGWRAQLLPTTEAPFQVGKAVKLNLFAHGGPSPSGNSGIMSPPQNQSDFSTASPMPGAIGDVRPLALERTGDGNAKAPARTREVALSMTWKAILEAELLGEHDGWEIQPFPIRSVTTGTGVPFDFSHDILVVEVATESGVAVIIDAGSAGGSNHSLGILVRTDGRFLSVSGVRWLRQQVAINNGAWRDKAGNSRVLAGYTIKPMNRPVRVWSALDAYANMIFHGVTTAIAASSQP